MWKNHATAMLLIIVLFAGTGMASTLDEVSQRGYLRCGVSTGIPGFSNPDDQGHWTGIDVDFCRAVAAACLGDASKVKYSALSAKKRIIALQTGEIDMLASAMSWTLARDTALGVSFAAIGFFDGQGFLVRKSLGVKSIRDLAKARVCIESGTTAELNIADYYALNSMAYTPVLFETTDQIIKAFDNGQCSVVTGDQTQLRALQLKLSDPQAAQVLPEVISKEPQGLVVRQGDEAWLSIVRWSLFAMITAEEYGITSTNVESQLATADPVMRRFFGLEGIKGEGLGLADDWAVKIVTQVGNYGEVFERNLGQGAPLKIDRGLNALWTQGGLLYAPPFR